MPNRILKDSICTSEEIDGLTSTAEILFYRLLVTVDDYGRHDARPKLLASKCYPLKSVDIKSLRADLALLQKVELVRLYEVEGRPYLCLPSWANHQQIRAKRAKCPAPEDGSDINGYQMQSDVHVNQSNPIQPGQPKTEKPAASPNGFAEFWSAYPKKIGKGAAEQAWKKQKPPIAECLQAIASQKRGDAWQQDGGRFIPNPATWINQKRWQDETGSPAKSVASLFANAI